LFFITDEEGAVTGMFERLLADARRHIQAIEDLYEAKFLTNC
jgi:hypothetical protein